MTPTFASLLMTLSMDAFAAEPALVSAYLGAIDIQNGNVLAGVSLCPQDPGDDGLPVIFDVQVDAATLDADDFSITTASGLTTVPSCATLNPAIDDDELFTVLLTGDLGTNGDRPVAVEVTGEVTSLDGEALDGLRIDEVTYPEEGTSLVFAFVDPAGPVCAGQGSTVEIAATFQGGITGPFNTVVGPLQRPGINIIGTRGRSWAPRGFDDVTDGDNHLVVCVPNWVDPVALEVDAGTLFDPGNNPNPATSVPVEAR